jgi:hypothetical protein
VDLRVGSGDGDLKLSAVQPTMSIIGQELSEKRASKPAESKYILFLEIFEYHYVANCKQQYVEEEKAEQRRRSSTDGI